MLIHRKIKVKNGSIEALQVKLGTKNLILLRGGKGYAMCGYLNLSAAEKFKDVAAKIIGVSTIDESLRTQVHSCTSLAKKLGIYKGQPVLRALSLIA